MLDPGRHPPGISPERVGFSDPSSEWLPRPMQTHAAGTSALAITPT